MTEIEFNEVSKVYDDGTQAVSDLDLKIEDGEMMVLVGPSGCGKTTALRMVAGLEKITRGELRIGDRIANGIAPKERNIAIGMRVAIASAARNTSSSVWDWTAGRRTDSGCTAGSGSTSIGQR